MTNYQIYLRTCRDLIVEVEDKLHCELPDSVNAYLVNLLAENFDKPAVLNYSYDLIMQSQQLEKSFATKSSLVSLAEKCLMISGITPFVAERRGFPPRHFTEQGKSLYQRAAFCTKPPDDFMCELGQQFNKMRDVVGATFDSAPKTFKQKRQLSQAGSATQTLVAIKLV